MDKKLVKHIAKLSSFELTESQLEQYTRDLTNICEILDTVKGRFLINNKNGGF